MIAVARHGETTWNLAGRYQGRSESGLSALGVRQGFALADAFDARMRAGSPLARIVASPLLRCSATAQFVAERFGMTVETDARLLEIAHGTWDGRYRDDLAREDPERFRAWRDEPDSVQFDGGERLSDVMDRWHAFAEHGLDTEAETLVVTHDVVVRCALLAATARPLRDLWRLRVENAAYAEFSTERGAGGELRLLAECRRDHLEGVRADPGTQAL